MSLKGPPRSSKRDHFVWGSVLEGWSAFWCDIKANHNSRRTSWAFPKGKSPTRIGFFITALQDGFLAFLIALCAQPMRRFGALCLWLQNIRDRKSTRLNSSHLGI